MITPQQVREIALLPNFDTGLITDAMIQATVDRHLVPLMGQDLYDALDSYSTLKDWAEMALGNLVVYDHMPRLYMRMTNIGAKVLSGDNSQSATDRDRAYLADYYLRQANVYLDKIREELETGDYAEFDTNDESIGYGTGIIL